MIRADVAASDWQSCRLRVFSTAVPVCQRMWYYYNEVDPGVDHGLGGTQRNSGLQDRVEGFHFFCRQVGR